jgi:CHAT domain-containing protein/predicted negative regulator of RcsB-dependent stress response
MRQIVKLSRNFAGRCKSFSRLCLGAFAKFLLLLAPKGMVQARIAVEATKVFEDGKRLHSQGTTDSLRMAIKKYTEAHSLIRKINDSAYEAAVLDRISEVHYVLGEKQKALEYLLEALLLWRTVGNQVDDTTTLQRMGVDFDDLSNEQRMVADYFDQPLSQMRAQGIGVGEAATLHKIGVIYEASGERQKALEHYHQSLQRWQAIGDGVRQAITLTRIGEVYRALGDKQKALYHFNQALPIMQTAGYRAQTAKLFYEIGRIYHDALGEWHKALDCYIQALPLWQPHTDRAKEAETLTRIGLIYKELYEYQKALQYYNKALKVWQTLGERLGEAAVLYNTGIIQYNLSEYQKALSYLNKALSIFQVSADRRKVAKTQYYIALVYHAIGSYQQALNCCEQTLHFSRELNDRIGEAAALTVTGKVYCDWGENNKALDYYNQALEICREIGNRQIEATVLGDRSRVCFRLGEVQSALNDCNQALVILRKIGDRDGEASTLQNLGMYYYELNENQRALDYLYKAQSIYETIGNHNGKEAHLIHNIGLVNSSLGKEKEALENFNQALRILRAIGDRANEATTLNSIGLVHKNLDDNQTALNYYYQALPIYREVGDRIGEAYALHNVGHCYAVLGDKQKALNYFSQALQLSRSVGNHRAEANTLFFIAHVQRDCGNLTEARTQVEAALTIIDSLRTKVISQELRASFFASKHDYYEFYIDLLMRLHQLHPSDEYDAEALYASERARARSLLELLTEARVNIRQGVDSELVDRERILQQQLNAKELYSMKLLSKEDTKEQATIVKKEIDALRWELQEVQAQIRATSPHYAELTQPKPLCAKEIQQQLLDENTMLLEYALGHERSFLWAVTSTNITSFELPKLIDIHYAAKRVYDLLTARNPKKSNQEEPKEKIQREARRADCEFPQAAAALSGIVLDPVAKQLDGKRLLIVADGALQYIPFAALPVPNATIKSSKQAMLPLIVEHEIINLPSASVLAELRREQRVAKPAPKTIAVLADPVFRSDDDRVKRNNLKLAMKPNEQAEIKNEDRASEWGSEKIVGEMREEIDGLFDSVPFSDEVVKSIEALVPSDEFMQALGFKASRSTAMSAELNQYRIIHFHTHGFHSGIVLSLVDERGKPQDGFLPLRDVYNLDLPADLVVLSACRTALGEEKKGEGLVGLTRGFMYAGTSRILASLWKVDAKQTANLMKRFYQGMLGEERLRPAAALRAAQLSMYREKDLEGAYYWAGFIMQGEWK